MHSDSINNAPVVTITNINNFRYLWLKNVKSFRAGSHCANCLVGQYDRNFGPKMDASISMTPTDALEGDVLYFCGVSSPYKHSSNMHLVGRVKTGAIASIDLFNGGTLTVTNFERIDFDDKTARALYPEKNESFLTCRNFQFGAQEFKTHELQANQ